MTDNEPAMDRVYCARRAAEEQELAQAASDRNAAEAHARLQRVYLERASIGDRPGQVSEVIG